MEEVMRTHRARLIAALSTQFRDIDLAEDVLQDALVAASVHWANGSLPANPAGWLYQCAKRKAIDRYRRESTKRAKAPSLAHHMEALNFQDLPDMIEGCAGTEIPDARLRLIFACCHPALPEQAHISLCLKTVCGLTMAQTASAFLVSEQTMARRLSRAKVKIRQAGIPFEIPAPDLWQERWQSVLGVVYLIFNQGYSKLGDEARHQNGETDLCQQAIDLARILLELKPKSTECAGLLALMLLSNARANARTKTKGTEEQRYISLAEQDRSLWNKPLIEEAQILLLKTMAKGDLGPYQIQAAISAVHSQAPLFEDTDWSEICALYERLYAYEPTEVVLLNASVALSFAKGAKVGLVSLAFANRTGKLAAYQPYHAARADILRRDDQYVLARAAYTKAIALTSCPHEKKFLKTQMDSMPS